MKKAILVLLTATILFSLVACASDKSTEEHTFVSHEAKQATCDEDGNDAYYTCSDCDKIFDANKKVISAIPVISALGHNYELQSGKDATCVEGGVIEHYSCDVCDKVFDLDKNEITDVATVVDSYNHASSATIVADTTNVKTTYKAGENFDATGLVVTCKCESCEGYVVDNQALTYVYQDENATAFALNDTKVTVVFNEMAFDVTVTVTKNQAVISGVEETYVTSCGVAPVIEATANNQELDIVIEYYDAENQEVEATNFVEGATYTAKIYIEETDEYLGAEVTSTVTVAHKYEWKESAEDWKKVNHICNCGETKDYYVMNYQSPYVDADNLGIDLFAFVYGTENVTVKEIKQVVRVKDGSYLNAIDGEVVDIDYTNEGVVYSFSADKYEQPTEYKPYILTLLVTYEVEGAEFNAYVEAKLVDKVIKNAEDLKLLAYKDDPDTNEIEVDFSYYVLGSDIDATNVQIDTASVVFNKAYGFRGVFDGNGYTISNLTIPNWNDKGLFGEIGGDAKIQNVNFENVTLGQGAHLFSLVASFATFANVNVEFSSESTAFTLMDTSTACVYNNVIVKTFIEEDSALLKILDNENNPIEDSIIYNYYPYASVVFDTDGAGEIDSIVVSLGKTIVAPTTPNKPSDDYDYEFLGWYNSETKFDFNTPISEGITLVAKWNQTEKKKAEDVVNIISALPESVTMPDHVYFVSRILDAKSAYDALPEDLKTQVTNLDKLNGLLANIDGYTTIFRQNVVGSTVIPSTVPNYTSTVGGTSAIRQDSLYGNVLTVTSNSDGKAALHCSNFPSVAKYEKVYFFVKVSVACDIYLADGVTNDGWGDNWKNTWSVSGFWCGENSWRMVEFNVSDGYAGTNFVIGFRSSASGFTFEISDIFVKELPPVPDTAIGLTFGNFVDSGTTNDYGKVYNLTQGWASDSDMGAFNQNALSGAVLAGHNALYFWIYNPNSSDVNFSFSGDMNGWNPTGDHVTTLTAGAWTKVVITPEIIAQGNSGTWFVGVSTGAGTSGWQISSLYSFAL